MHPHLAVPLTPRRVTVAALLVVLVLTWLLTAAPPADAKVLFLDDFERGNLSGWTVSGQASVISSLGPIRPRDGSRYMALVSTGDQAVDRRVSTISRTFTPPAAAATGYGAVVEVDWQMVSEEYPEFVGTGFNDTVEAKLVLTDGTEIIVARETVNQADFRPVSGINFPGGDDTVGATGWRKGRAYLTPATVARSSGARVVVSDIGDAEYDTVLLVDNVRVSTVVQEVAHRGDREVAPENTMPAVDSAVAKRAKFIEIDVYLNSKNEPIVLHDRHYVPPGTVGFDTVAGPTRDCWNRNFETDDWDTLMSRCDVSRGYSGYTGTRVPLLRDVLAKHGRSGSTFMVEMKKSRNMPLLAQRVTALLNEHVPAGRRWVTSFEEPALDATGAGILRMRQVPIGTSVVSATDNAVAKGYNAINTDLSAWGERVCVPRCMDVPEYVSSRGLLLSAYTLTRTSAANNRDALAYNGDFFMTDRVSDLQATISNRRPLH